MKSFSYLLTAFIILSCSSASKTASTTSGKMYFPGKPVSIGINKIPDSLTQKFYNQLNEYKIKTISQQEAIELYKEEYTRSFNSITSANNNTAGIDLLVIFFNGVSVKTNWANVGRSREFEV